MALLLLHLGRCQRSNPLGGAAKCTTRTGNTAPSFVESRLLRTGFVEAPRAESAPQGKGRTTSQRLHRSLRTKPPAPEGYRARPGLERHSWPPLPPPFGRALRAPSAISRAICSISSK